MNTNNDTGNKYLLPIAVIVGGLFIAGAVMWSGSRPAPTGQQAGSQQVGTQPSGLRKVSIDDDPVLGDKNAPVTIVEFSDYECPFCQRSFNDVLPGLKKNYIDTGKVKLVFRDFPLSFHANAHKEAEAAECARSQGDDSTYYMFHDKIFTQTTSNGTGLALTQLPVIAKSLGLNVSQFQQCLDSGTFKAEVDKDISDGSAAGVAGTPAWFIGKSSKDGVIEGQYINGAYPYANFQSAIDELLK